MVNDQITQSRSVGSEPMRGVDDRQDGMFSYISLDARVPEEHPLRPIRVLVDGALKALTKEFEAMYAVDGRPSIAPERLLRASGSRKASLMRSTEATISNCVISSIVLIWCTPLWPSRSPWCTESMRR